MRPRAGVIAPLLLLMAAALLVAGCSGGDDSASAGGDDETPTPPSDDGRAGGPEPQLEGPVSRFSPLLDDLGSGYFAEFRNTFVLDTETYASVSLFPTESEGQRRLQEWGYAGGYQTGFEPERREIDVLNGKFYASVEVHLFEDTEGAQGFFEYVESKLSGAGAQRVSAPALANASSGWFTIDTEPVPNSDISAVFHWYLFRRGNMVGSVRTWGAQPLMTIDKAREIAIIMDEKALGDREAVEPTPVVLDSAPTPTPAQ